MATNRRTDNHNCNHNHHHHHQLYQDNGMVLTSNSLPISSERNVNWSSNFNTALINVKVERWTPSSSSSNNKDSHQCRADSAAWIESKKLEEERIRRHRDLAEFQRTLKTRLQMHAKKKKEALSDALDQVAVQSTQRQKRCSHLSSCKNHPRQYSPSLCASLPSNPTYSTPRRAFPLPATLSSESLNIMDLPSKRTYFVHQSDSYHYFHNNAQQHESTTIPVEWDLKAEEAADTLERELRLFYRESHIDEIRRKQFRAIYQATRQKYSQEKRKEASEWREKMKSQPRSVSPEQQHNKLRIKKSATSKSLASLFNDTRIHGPNHIEYRVEKYITTSSQTELLDLKDRETIFDEVD